MYVRASVTGIAPITYQAEQERPRGAGMVEPAGMAERAWHGGAGMAWWSGHGRAADID